MTTTNGAQTATRDGILGADQTEVITIDQGSGRELTRCGRKHGDDGLREFAFPHAFTERTGPTWISTSSIDRPAGAMAAALAAPVIVFWPRTTPRPAMPVGRCAYPTGD
jgi:hypothetical protein